MNPVSARSQAFQVLRAWLATNLFPDRLLDETDSPRAATREIALGVVRRRRSLEFILQRYVKRSPGTELQALLLAGTYELMYMQDSAPYGVVNDTVALGRRSGGKSGAALLNAVLRRIAENRIALRAEAEKAPLGIRLSFPDDLLRRWLKQYGHERTETLCRGFNQPADVTIRLRSPAAMAEFLAAWPADKPAPPPHPYNADFLIVPRGYKVRDLPGYAAGLFMVQDPATADAVALLDPQPGEDVLDACAAPGGKTILLADRLGGKGSLAAADIHEDRLAILRENLKRAGLAENMVTVCRQDATRLRDMNRTFDAILLDAPCSNTGVIRRRPDARWRFEPDRLAGLLHIQHALLDSAAQVLKPGGRMVYSTCSLEPEEDEWLVAKWLAKHPGFRLAGERKLFPPETGTDGAYAARIERRP